MAGAIFFNDNKNDIFWGGWGVGNRLGAVTSWFSFWFWPYNLNQWSRSNKITLTDMYYKLCDLKLMIEIDYCELNCKSFGLGVVGVGHNMISSSEWRKGYDEIVHEILITYLKSQLTIRVLICHNTKHSQIYLATLSCMTELKWIIFLSPDFYHIQRPYWSKFNFKLNSPKNKGLINLFKPMNHWYKHDYYYEFKKIEVIKYYYIYLCWT